MLSSSLSMAAMALVSLLSKSTRDPGNGAWGGGRERSMDKPEMGQTPNEKAQRMISGFFNPDESILFRNLIKFEHKYALYRSEVRMMSEKQT